MGMTPDWKAYRTHYLEDGTEQSFVTVADGESGCRRNLKLLRGDGARFMRNEKHPSEFYFTLKEKR